MTKIDYTKFKLKPKEELIETLKDKNNIFVIACKKCFKDFVIDTEPECEELAKIAVGVPSLLGRGKLVVGCSQIDFLCNKIGTEKKIKELDLSKTNSVFVISCGLGIQTVADISEGIPTYAASDSVSHGGYHGVALSYEKCAACGQCYLNETAGICPIVDCSKSLLNGPCGGAKNGKCEVDKTKDCGWEKIYKKLDSQNRVKEIIDIPPKLRDYSKVDFKFISEYVSLIRNKRFEGFYGGFYPIDRKELSENKTIETFPEVDTVVIPLSQHTGKICEPLVKKGDKVKVGQKIGDTSANVSSPVHSSVSGTVLEIEERLHPITSTKVLSIVIKSDKKNELHESVKPYGKLEELSPSEIIDIVREKGIVGMGGAGFPASVKLKSTSTRPSAKEIEVVLLNGCECEPLLTADYRVMLEYADDVIFGLKAIMKATNAKKGIIAIEDNKQDAIEIIMEKIKNETSIEVVSVKTKYPQGAEKMLIKRILGRTVPLGGLPLDVGVVVNNVSTAKAISDAINKGLPLIKRIVSVTGEKIKRPGNFEVKIGTLVSDILIYCDIYNDNTVIKIGGPIMGIELKYVDVPVVKGTTGIIAIEKPDVELQLSCIKCGRCVDVCPMELTPSYYVLYGKEEKWKDMEKYKVFDCIECGCCENICSSKSSLVSVIKKSKKILRETE